MFLKFPGRDLGGVLAFLRGFRTDAWLALLMLLLSLPAALALASLTLRLAGIHETQESGVNNYSNRSSFMVICWLVSTIQTRNSNGISKLTLMKLIL